MRSTRRPDDERLQRFLEAQAAQVFSYAEVGQSADAAPVGYNLDHNRVLLGRGEEAFHAACQAIARWQMFPAHWTEIWPRGASQEVGTPVLMLARIFGLWWVNACRVVYRVNGHEAARLLTALQYFRLAYHDKWPILLRGCWCVVAVSLVFSMWLAALYGSRAYVPISWLDIPMMRALHGIANSVGVGLAGMLGWTAATREDLPRRGI